MTAHALAPLYPIDWRRCMTTFSISVKVKPDIEPPLSDDDILNYIWLTLETGNVLSVTNLVRDY